MNSIPLVAIKNGKITEAPKSKSVESWSFPQNIVLRLKINKATKEINRTILIFFNLAFIDQPILN